MNAYFVLPLVQTVFCLTLAWVVIRSHYRGAAHRFFALYLLGLAGWGVIIFLMRSSPGTTQAYFWERFLVPFGPLISVVLYHFSVRYTSKRSWGWHLPVLYVFALAFIPLAATPLVFSGMQVKPYGFAPVLGPLALLWALFGYGLGMAALSTFVWGYRRSSYAEERNRLAYITVGIVISLLGGITDILPVLGLPSYPGLIISNLIFCSLTTVAILKYKLLDIRLVLRKSAAYAMTSAGVTFPFVVGFLLITRLIGVSNIPTWTYFFLVLVLALAMPPLWRVVQGWVDRLFYRERYDYLRAVEKFSRETQRLADPEQLVPDMVNLVANALRTRNVCILLPVSGGDGFLRAYCNPSGGSKVTLGAHSPLLRWFRRSEDIVACKDLDVIPQLQSMNPGDREQLKEFGAEFIAPLKTRGGQLAGLLILGSKLSEQHYTLEDKQLISALCGQITVKLENASLYDDALRTRQNLEAWFQAMADGVMIADSEYRIQFANKAFSKTFGDCIGKICWLSIGKSGPCNSCLFRKVVKEDKEETFRFSDYLMERDYNIVVAPLRNPSGTRSVIEVFRDMTAERVALERLYESGRLAAVGRLAAGVAHEINNPLTGVLGFAERVLGRDLSVEVRKDLEIVYNEANRAAKVVKNLLTFARSHRQDKVPGNINDVIKATLELRAYEMKVNGIQVVAGLDPDLPLVQFDYHQMQQVFLNIILNAEQAMAEAHHGGTLSVKSEMCVNNVAISIADDGPGIPRENLRMVFEPFFTTKEVGSGTGLGLSVCHGIVVEHGGKIYVESEFGHGSVFKVELPVYVSASKTEVNAR